MTDDRRQVFAFSGLLTAGDGGGKTELLLYPLTLTDRTHRQRVCYVPTAVGDASEAVRATRARFAEHRPDVQLSVLSLFPRPNVDDVRAHLLAQDVITVEGGSVVNLMAIWRARRLPEVLVDAWHAGVVLAGASAGSLCWHTGGPTDSYSDRLDPFTDGLGLLPHSNGVHDDFPDQPRRATYRAMVADGRLPGGYATEDGVGLHYVGSDLHEAVSVRAGAHAWSVRPTGSTSGPGWTENAVPARLL